jgi:hypothetical protein
MPETSALPPPGRYRYEIRNGGAVRAFEEAIVDDRVIQAIVRTVDGLTTHQVDASLDGEGRVSQIALRYASSLFKRDATYRADGESFRGNVSAMAGRNEVVIKLGRFGEVDAAELVIFRALLVGRVRFRGQVRWTGRVAVINPSSLMAASLKQTCRLDTARGFWIYEARMGDAEEIEIDPAGRITHRRDSRGRGDQLVAFEPLIA